jgi:maltose O-acetyltransferase
MTQYERMTKGMAYISDEDIFERQKPARRLTQKLNTMDRADFEGIQEVTRQLLGRCGKQVMINPPFYCDYGYRIEVGENFFANYNTCMLDTGKIVIGDNCFLAPNVSIYTAGHPLHPDSRNSMYEYGADVTIGDNVWIGGNTVICPGVTIGNHCVIGAGSVVTKDVPDWSLAAGNPCRVIRKITEEDRRYYYKRKEFDEEAWMDISKGTSNHA